MYYDGPMSLLCFSVLSKILSPYQGYREVVEGRGTAAKKKKGKMSGEAEKARASEGARVILEVGRKDENAKLPQMCSRGQGRRLLLFKNKTKNGDDNYIILTIKNIMHR